MHTWDLAKISHFQCRIVLLTCFEEFQLETYGIKTKDEENEALVFLEAIIHMLEIVYSAYKDSPTIPCP